MGKSSRRKRAARVSPRHAPLRPRVRRSQSAARAFIMSVLPALAIFLGTRQLLAEAFRIPSGSMEPTLLVGDWLFVNKLRFGPHIPFTNWDLPGYARPTRGDVTVFVSPPQDVTIRIVSRRGHADAGEAHRRSRRRYTPHASRAADSQRHRRSVA